MFPDLWLVFSRERLRLFSLGCAWLINPGLPGIAIPVTAAEVSSAPLATEQERPGKRISVLRAELAHHDELYFRKAAPEISDAEYDRLKRELNELEKAHPEAAAGTDLTPALGDDRSGLFPTYRHRARMLSLSKSYSESEMRAFDARVSRQLKRDDLEYMVEPKFDGLAISVTYEKGKFVRAATHGNGIEGDDVTSNALTIRTLPRELRSVAPDGTRNPMPDVIELRGEIYLTFAEFDRINHEREEAGEETYANPRNLAAGTLKQLDPHEVARRKLQIVFYGWGGCQPTSAIPDSQKALLEQLRGWGLPTIEAPRLVKGADAMWQAVREVGHERKRLPFPIDGVVVKLNSVVDRQRLGATELAPNWAMAFKFQPEQVVTQVRGITLQVGRTGLLTPVAELEPVSFGGSTITRASLHNRDKIERRDIRIGDYVILEKAGEIIPVITEVVVTRRPATASRYVFPEKCPACHAVLAPEPGEAAVRCPNGACPAQVRRRIEYFASKLSVNIPGLGPATIEALVSHGLLKSVADLYHVKRTDLLAVGGVGARKADKLLAEIERSRHAELWRFVNGLSIPGVGSNTAKALAVRYGSLEAVAQCSRRELLPVSGEGIAGVGHSVAESVLAFFEGQENRMLIAALIDGGVQPRALEKPGRSD